MNEETSLTTLLRNVVFNSGGWAVNLVVALLATPYFVMKLTPEGYGVYALILSLLGYYQLLDPGLAQGVTKFVAQFSSSADNATAHRFINAALLFEGAVGLVASAVLVGFADRILQVLSVSPGFYEQAKLGLYLCAGGFLAQMLAKTLSSALSGLQRYDFTATVDAGANTLFNLLGIILLHVGYGLAALIGLKVATILVTLGLFIYGLRRETGGIGLTYGVSRRIYKQLFSFSGFLFISQLSGTVTNYLVTFVIGAYLGPAAVTLYVVPRKLVQAIGGFLSRAAAVVFPYASELDARGDLPAIRRTYTRASRLFASFSIPLLLALAVFSRHILTVWMGPDFVADTWVVLTIISGTALLGALTTVPSHIAVGLGYTRVKSYFSIVSMALYALLLPTLTPRWSVEGTALAVLLASTLPGWSFVLYATRRILALPIRQYLRSVFAIHTVPVVISMAVLPLVVSRPTSWWLIACLPLAVGAYFFYLAVSGWIPLSQIVDLANISILKRLCYKVRTRGDL